jgi:cobalt transporter subunit CbtB
MKPNPVGCDGPSEYTIMTTISQTTRVAGTSTMMSVLAAAFLGLALITVAGHVQASALHNAAHDMRHATGFPCH